ncbi:L,D-transpeptidase family protein [Photobacterium sanguinicancri]|uniref:L,D-transpeptidase family protein n=1 Tax=Photobacterium sanguinicancri TaxID=875932 RepID=UPI0026E47BDE|nr:L,D-transpeptidase family protein [Photobacterium sanguinicancri]MDO6499072.1 L,D-transpeptidase family protein [Photobacterium sanguinicancri]
MYRSLLISLTCLASSIANAIEYPLPEDSSNLIGTMEYYQVEKGDSLADIANSYNVGFLALLEANKGVDPFLPAPGKLLAIPTQLILPKVDREGVVINLAELRLYYFPEDQDVVHVFPIGIGRVGRETPLMTTKISQKTKNPTWTPTANIRKEYREKRDIELPSVVPAGPENPLGDYAMRLAHGSGQYLIHGTNKDFGIGMRVSSGCIRMNPWDIEWLFPQIPKGTKVQIIDQALKQTQEPDGSLYVEVHQPLSKTESQLGQDKKVKADEELLLTIANDDRAYSRLNAALNLQMGIPVEIKSLN